ncbi:anaerobic C4-dicarboxylate transporter family protein [Anaeromyxobacter dehalogenans]|uniref:Anaerobic c4-dicarboxylate membrane transporter family protein n=1 Tax=Anaeromyxobacter dehalogenans (strain 2CP-C) TaxID=290397 RepID=Q2IIQ0_ANADE|nr:anaerobic C4-dicarboxylate transporter [Anaeromyxobacter dehalogenans]ABC81529.1 anaerobic c4-dicarboxylate membrane transporter family protein [Anaeromyxobacter dehalogenans 2CP-C]
MIWLQLVVVLAAIFVGARLGGIGLGVMGGLGLGVLTFVFHLQPTSPPIDVLLMIAAVVTAAGVLQAAGGLDYLVSVAERILRSNPDRITFLGPLVTYVFTLFAGTGHVAYSVLPVISEVARETGVRPERPMSISVIASQQAITASPISAATVALLGMLSTGAAGAAFHIELIDILKVCIPSTLLGVLAAAFVANRMGKDLEEDPEYQDRVARGLAAPTGRQALAAADGGEPVRAAAPVTAKIAVGIFLAAALAVVLFGSFPGMRPQWTTASGVTKLGMPHAIEMVMLSAAALMLMVCRVDVSKVATGSVFGAGVQAVIAIFGIAWMGDTFFAGNMEVLGGSIKGMVTAAPWLFAAALFALSVLLYSQAATVRALMPLGIALGIPAPALMAMFPAVNGYFFIPNYPTIVAAINFDRTGTTRIGRWVLNHSFMVPGLISTVVAIATGLVIVRFMF